jgi:UDP-glucose 4,6-dehydratase
MQSFGLPVVITRSNNVYGPHQYPEKLVPKFMMLLSLNRPLTVHGNGQNTRSYFYVEDLAEAFDIVLHKGVTGSTYNLGTIEERTVLDVCKTGFATIDDLLNLDKATELGIKPSTSFKDGLSKTYEWFKANVFGKIYWEGLSRALAAHPGLAMPPIALGTWKLSTVDQCFNIVVAAIRAGYRHIDCAKMYNNEAEVGRAIAACIKTGDGNCKLKP